jgi:hypothetical protein
MSDVEDLFKGVDEDPMALRALLGAMQETSPLVAKVLSGDKNEYGKVIVNRASVQFYLDSSGLNACIQPKEGDIMLFIRIKEPSSPWLSLEASLMKGDFNRKKRDVRKPSY